MSLNLNYQPEVVVVTENLSREDWLNYRRLGIGKEMVVHCMNALKAEKINKVSLIAFTINDIGNAFWNTIGWTKREDLNYYDFTLNEANITAFNK